VIHVKGDIWDIAMIAVQAGPIAIGHGVNCRGVWGAGIAVQFKGQFPKAYLGYQDVCNELPIDELIGQHQICQEQLKINTLLSRQVFVVNLFSQVNPGSDARLTAIKTALDGAFEYFRSMALYFPLIIPMIGAGIGGLTQDEVLGLFNQYDDRLVVVEYDR
jgi:O-acetyl-ADP-ribose deacetylase (regulator of RNase III)